MITLDLSILNQKGTPMFNSDLFANRPAAGIVGRIFISTDTNALFRDTGSTWVSLGGGGGGTIAGSIATGQVAFGTAANTIGGNNNLFWDNASTFLGINTNTPNNNLVVNTIVSDGGILIKQNNTTIGELRRVGTNNYSKLLLINSGIDNIDLNAGGFSYIRQNNFAIGSSTDSGDKFQVYGNSLLKGSTNDATATALIVQNLSGANLFRVVNDNTIFLHGTTYLGSSTTRARIFSGGSFSESAIISAPANRQVLRVVSGTIANNIDDNSSVFEVAQTISSNLTINNVSNTILSGPFSTNGGSVNFNSLLINNTITQNVGANGTTRGIYINPTLNTPFSYRAIEWTNNVNWGLYGTGTAPSYFAGNVQIGSTTAIGSNIKLQVTGSAAIVETSAYSTGTTQSFVIQRNTTINTTISASSGICNYVSTGDSTIQSSQSVPASTSFAGIYSYNKYAFASAGLTLTATQAAGNGLRSISQLQTQNVFKGTNSGTITHVSGIQIAGFYNDNNTLITPVIPNAYQLIINDTGAYGHTFTFTNRWGIYQEGINDRNYLAGNLLLNSTTDTGQILQVNGAIRVNGQSSATAGGASGQHLIINVDGTQYKIALLNP